MTAAIESTSYIYNQTPLSYNSAPNLGPFSYTFGAGNYQLPKQQAQMNIVSQQEAGLHPGTHEPSQRLSPFPPAASLQMSLLTSSSPLLPEDATHTEPQSSTESGRLERR